MANEKIDGATLVALSLRRLGVTTIFGLTGYPVTSVLERAIDQGIRFIGFRNEQAASYAATAYGYLTGKPACCIVVGGPGVVHAMAGVVNSSGNCFPLLLLAGSCESSLTGRGAFQELDTISMLSPHVKLALRPPSLKVVPSAISQAYQAAWYGRPGTGFVDLPADFLQATCAAPPSSTLPIQPPSPPMPFPDVAKVRQIANLLQSASAPLVVIGKGSAYARAETILRELVDRTQLPFLATPMGKGVVPDSHPCSTAAARSNALKNADVVLVLGARLNWILHFGAAPKWNASAKIIQVDIDPNAIGQNFGDASLGIVSDVKIFVRELLGHLDGWKYGPNTLFRRELSHASAANEAVLAKAAQRQTVPLTFEHAYHTIRSVLDTLSPLKKGEVVYVAEGARTMDTSRSWFVQEHPRLRLDAGTHGTMGIGLGYMIAAWEAYNGAHAEASSGAQGRKKIVGIIGDSAFGFSGSEIETMSRLGMDCLIFVMNNGGVYHGHADTEGEFRAQQTASREGRGKEGLRSWSLTFETRYEMFAAAVGGRGYLVRTSEELERATEEGFKARIPVVVNVLVESGKGFPAVFGFEVKGEEDKTTSSSLPESKL